MKDDITQGDTPSMMTKLLPSRSDHVMTKVGIEDEFGIKETTGTDDARGHVYANDHDETKGKRGLQRDETAAADTQSVTTKLILSRSEARHVYAKLPRQSDGIKVLGNAEWENLTGPKSVRFLQTAGERTSRKETPIDDDQIDSVKK